MTMNKKRRRRGRRRMSYWANDKIRASFGVTLVYLLRYRVPLLDIYRSWHLEWFSWRIHSVVSNHRRILLLRKDSQAWIAPGKTSKTIHNGKYIYYYLAQKVYAWLCDCQIQFNHICNLFFFSILKLTFWKVRMKVFVTICWHCNGVRHGKDALDTTCTWFSQATSSHWDSIREKKEEEQNCPCFIPYQCRQVCTIWIPCFNVFEFH